MRQSVLNTYKRNNLCFLKGEGSWLLADNKRWYLDFGSGIAVNVLGHSNPVLIKALNVQSKLLWHTSNLFEIKKQEELADLLVSKTFADKVFFTNSGAESVECAIKIARKYGKSIKKDKFKIISFTGAFHGRTYGAISVSSSKKLSEGFEPTVPGVVFLPFNQVSNLEKDLKDDVCGVIVEPIQGEGGINEANKNFILKLKEICDKKDIVLIFDEIQSGIGRSGSFFAYEFYKIKPDIVTAAKGIGGGFPIGCCLVTDKIAKKMTVGSHGSTFGGNPLGCSVSIAILNEIFKAGFLDEVIEKSNDFKNNLINLINNYPSIFEEVRGRGFMLGLKCNIPNSIIVEEALKNNLIVIPGGDNTIRILPPINISKKDLNTGIEILKNVANCLENIK